MPLVVTLNPSFDQGVALVVFSLLLLETLGGVVNDVGLGWVGVVDDARVLFWTQVHAVEDGADNVGGHFLNVEEPRLGLREVLGVAHEV